MHPERYECPSSLTHVLVRRLDSPHPSWGVRADLDDVDAPHSIGHGPDQKGDDERYWELWDLSSDRQRLREVEEMVEDWRPFLQTRSALASHDRRETHCIQRDGHNSQVSIHAHHLGRQPYAEVVVSNAVLNF
jgi:hypothetical protein